MPAHRWIAKSHSQLTAVECPRVSYSASDLLPQRERGSPLPKSSPLPAVERVRVLVRGLSALRPQHSVLLVTGEGAKAVGIIQRISATPQEEVRYFWLSRRSAYASSLAQYRAMEWSRKPACQFSIRRCNSHRPRSIRFGLAISRRSLKSSLLAVR